MIRTQLHNTDQATGPPSDRALCVCRMLRAGAALTNKVSNACKTSANRASGSALAKKEGVISPLFLLSRGHLIDLLHLAALIAVLLERRQLLDVIRLVVVLNGEAKLDHAVDAASKGGGLVKREA